MGHIGRFFISLKGFVIRFTSPFYIERHIFFYFGIKFYAYHFLGIIATEPNTIIWTKFTNHNL